MSAPSAPVDAGASDLQRALRASLGSLGAVGTLFFGALFVASWVDPLFVERLAKEVIRIEVQKRVEERIDTLDAAYLARKAKDLIAIEKAKIAGYKEQMRRGLPKRLAAVLDEMRDPDCKCRPAIEGYFRFEGRIAQAQEIIEHLDGLIRAKYLDAAAQVTREFRIFTGSNTLVFAMLALAVFARKRAGVHLVPAAAVLLATAGLTAYFYLFNQDWLHTLVFGQYVGLAYLGYLTIVLVLFVDVVFNRARGTALAINLVGSLFSSAVAVLPC